MEKISEKYTRAKLISTSNLTEKIMFNPEYTDNVERFFSMPKENRIVLLHSVRVAKSMEEPEFIARYIEEQESQGNAVYIPKKYNFQQDETGGIVICNTMRYVIKNSGMVAIGYNPESEGTKVDYGMTLYSNKNVVVLNPELDIDDQVYDWMKKNKHLHEEFGTSPYNSVWLNIVVYPRLNFAPKYTPRPNNGEKEMPPMLSEDSALEFGMILASQKPFKITNPDMVQNQIELEDRLGHYKSYSKVAHALDGVYNKHKR